MQKYEIFQNLHRPSESFSHIFPHWPAAAR